MNIIFFMCGTVWPPEVVHWRLLSSYTTIIGALILWLTFLFFGIIAKRYEMVLRRKTQWQFIMWAPSGILIYAFIKFYDSVILGYLKLANLEALIGYGLFFLSGIFSLMGAVRFYRVVSPRRKGGTE